jgi:tetratricopeptide (TPR) repeat protein
MCKNIFVLFAILFLYSTELTAQNDYTQKIAKEIQNGNKDQALIYIDEAIKLYPDNISFLDIKAVMLYETGKIDESLDAYFKLLNIDSTLFNPYIMIGYIFENKKKNYDKAINYYVKSLPYATDDSLMGISFYTLGRINYNLNKMDYSYTYLKKAAEYDSLNLEVLITLGAVCDELKKEEEAFIHLNKVLRLNPNNVKAYNNIGFIYLDKGDFKMAIKYFDKIIALKNNEAFAFNNRAFCNLKLGNLKKALADVNTSIELDPENAYAYRNRGLIFIEMDEEKKACINFSTAIEKGFSLNYGEEVEQLKIKYCK